MAEILLVNPRRRKRRKLSAKQRKYFGKRRKRSVSRRRRRSHTAAAPRRRRNPSRAVRRIRRRRNPSLRGIGGQIVPAVKAGLIGAAGGLGLSVGVGFLAPKLPAQLQSGYGLTAVKVLGAIGVGILGNMVLRGKGSALATGAMTVALYDELKKLVVAQFPAIPLGEYMSMAPVVGYDDFPALEAGSEYAEGEMGEYMEMGEYETSEAY